MYAEKSDSMMKKILRSLCCSYGWCYGIFWGFDQRNSLLLTFKDAYYEQQMEALIDAMLLQAHVTGGGVIGQAAFMKNHQWMHSDALHQRQYSLGSFDSLEVFQDDSELFYQFSMGIKTIAVISVEPWGVVQLGSTQKNPETKGFVDRVKEHFREMEILENEPYSDIQFLDSSTQITPVLSGDIFSCLNQDMKNGSFLEGSMEANHSLVLPSQSLLSTSDDPIENPIQIECGHFFDCSIPLEYESCGNASFDAPLNLDDCFNGCNFAISTPGLEDDFSQWFSPQANSTPFASLHTSRLVQMSSLSGTNTPVCKSQSLPTNSLLSSVTDAFIPSYEVKDFQCISEKHIGPKTPTSNSLFSKLGLDQLLDGVSRARPCPLAQSRFDDRSSSDAKRRKIDKFESVPKAKKIELNSEDSPKKPHSWVGESSVINNGKTSLSRGHEEREKTKKKAKPGPRPRPKDRQMIQDRLAELRDLIPNGDKMSIDRLLERTVRHLNFMQSVKKHAESLKQADKPKSREVHEIVSSNGATWACEVGDEAMLCPLIVEDLSTPGQMLIEMICEEQGFFLEIVDVIRHFGLIIRKGVMEVCETNKIWAHFLVEAEGNRGVSRHEIFSSLIQLLQLGGKSAVNASDSYGNVVRSEVPAFRASASSPVNLADALQCANL